MKKFFKIIIVIILLLVGVSIFIFFNLNKYTQYFSLSTYDYEKSYNPLTEMQEATGAEYKCFGYINKILRPGGPSMDLCLGVRYEKKCFHINYIPAVSNFMQITEKNEINCN